LAHLDVSKVGIIAIPERKETSMAVEQAVPETKGVTVKLLSALNRGNEIEGMAGRLMIRFH
jgi:hypothetical protein